MYCPAKINLFLKVLGKREDGYHNLETIFLPIFGLADDLKIKLAEHPDQPSTMKVKGPYQVPADDSNLCLKAVRAFQEETGITQGVTVTLTKNIPVAAGLGGGSSDAATTLKSLNKLFHAKLDPFRLRAIARKLGADIPFFIEPEVALGTGIGDILTPAPLQSNLTVILVTPCFPLPVAWAYKHRFLPANAQLHELPELQKAMIVRNNQQQIATCCRNDLEHAIFQKFPILELMRQELMKLGAYCAHVSGSGPSLFALANPVKATDIRDAFAQQFPGFPPPTIHTFTVA